MKLALRILLPGAALLGGLLLLYARTNRFDIAEHGRFDTNLDRLGKLDAALNQDVLKARFRLLTDYDGFNLEIAELRKTVTTLETMPTFVPAAGRPGFHERLAQFSRLLAQKEQLLEAFKSGNAVLNNSLRYLPAANRELLTRLGSDDASRELRVLVNDLMRQVLVYCLDSGEDENPALQTSLRLLTQWRGAHPEHQEIGTVFGLASHVASIARRKPKIEALTTEIIALPTAACVDDLLRLYDTQLAAVLEDAERFRLVLQMVCAALVLGIGYVLYALHGANRSLEHRVAERTRALQSEAAEHCRTADGLRTSEQRFRTLSVSAPIGIFLTDAAGLVLYVNPHWLAITELSQPESLGESWQSAAHPADAAAVTAEWTDISGTGAAFDHEFRFRTPAGEIRWVHARTSAIRSDTGEVTGHVGTIEDITERRRTEAFLNSVLQNLPIGIFLKDAKELRFALWNKANEELSGLSHAETIGKNDHEIFSPELADNFVATDRAVLAGGQLVELEEEIPSRHCGPRILHTRKIPILDGEGRPLYLLGISEDITARKVAETNLERLHQELLSTSRQAGMAEIATAVLHNVGNVLNSVNVASICVADGVRKSRGASLARVVAMLREHEADLGAFFTSDPRAKQLPGFLAQLSDHLASERATALQELAHLQKNLDHIKDIVSMQQTYAKVSGVTETVQIIDLLEDTLRMNAESFIHHDLAVVREFSPVPPVTVDKHKVLQILINLVRNAKHACDDGGRPEKTMTLRVFNGNGTVKVAVSDNGIGIPAENITRIFNHGFTTKKEGHGFGLHSGALTAKELGGSLRVESQGTGHGATFTLELPVAAVA